MLTDGLKKIFSLCRSLVCRSYQISLSRCVTSSVICRKVEHVSPRELLYEMLLFPRSKGNLPRAPPATEDPGAWPRALLCWAVAAPCARQREIPEMRKGRGGSERGREICRKPTSFCTECQPGSEGAAGAGAGGAGVQAPGRTWSRRRSPPCLKTPLPWHCLPQMVFS